jgi:hypothetical protein
MFDIKGNIQFLEYNSENEEKKNYINDEILNIDCNSLNNNKFAINIYSNENETINS